MEANEIKQITNRLYKAYTSTELKRGRQYRVKGENYKFRINVDNDGRFSLLSVDKGDFNEIRKILNAIPFLVLIKQKNIKLR